MTPAPVPGPIETAGRILALARAERDALSPEEAARRAWSPGGPSVEEITATIRRHRAEARAARTPRPAAHHAA